MGWPGSIDFCAFVSAFLSRQGDTLELEEFANGDETIYSLIYLYFILLIYSLIYSPLDYLLYIAPINGLFSSGEVNVAQEALNSFLAVAEDLKVKGKIRL